MYLGDDDAYMGADRPGPEFIHEHHDFLGTMGRQKRRHGGTHRIDEYRDPHTDAVGTLYDIEDSDKGTEATLAKMSELAWKGRNDPFVVKNSMRIVRAAGIPRKQYIKEMECLFRYAQGTHPSLPGLRYFKDGYAVERVVSPRRTDEFGGGDCDDLTCWVCSHLLAIGHGPCRFVVVAADHERKDEFSHVYAWVRHPEGPAMDPEDGSRWFPLDPTVSKPFGWQVEDPFRRAYWEVG